METALLLGFLLGLQHALEADHVAAVSSIASRESSFRGMVRHGAVIVPAFASLPRIADTYQSFAAAGETATMVVRSKL